MSGVLRLGELRGERREEAGGKGLSLARLVEAGFAVPPAVVVPTGMTVALRGPVDGWPEEMCAAIVAAAVEVADGGTLAVRSSAVDEDGAEASFAGQHATVLGVAAERGAVLAAVAECIASLESAGAKAYRARQGAEAEGRMAVVIQRMIEPDLSGVAFTVDPLTGDRGRLVVEAVRGRGEGLVSGTVEGDRMVLSRDALQALETHHPGEAVLTLEMAQEVARAALKAVEVFGGEQDIEFCVKDGQLWLLQSRPITATGAGAMLPGGGWRSEFDSESGPDEVWTSANVQEVLPGLLPPLTMTVFADATRVAYTEGYQKLRLLDRDEWPTFVGLFYNRAYLNIGATRIIADRAIGGNADSVEHRFLGGEYRAKFDRPHTLTLVKYRLKSAPWLAWMTLTIHRAADRVERETLKQQKRVRRMKVETLSDGELEMLREELTAFGISVFPVHLQATACAGAGFDLIGNMLKPILKDETEAQLPALFTGMRGVESAQIGLDLWGLSRTALAAGMAAAVRAEGFDPKGEGLPPTWRMAWAAFMERHGHRGLNEMDPSVPNWRADPQPVVQMVRSYMDLPAEQSPAATLERQEAERLRLTASLEARMNPAKRLAFRVALRQAQGWVALRERTKSLIVRAARLADVFIPETGRRLVEKGVVERPDDLFFLTVDELRRALTNTTDGDYRERVARRRKEMERNRHILLPERFSGHPVPLEPDAAMHAGEVLTGTPVSPGIVTGRARVIFDPSTDGPMQPGEILVAPVTDAGWTPLFALAAGLVVDMGSALSHGSTVAREYGLPAVVNVRKGTRSIRTGDLITVNGSKGTVMVLSEAGAEEAPAG